MNSNYDSIYSISLEILKLIEQGGSGSGLTEEQVRNIIEAYNYITMADVESKGYITSSDLPKEWYGTQEEFDAIAVKDENTTYFIYE